MAGVKVTGLREVGIGLRAMPRAVSDGLRRGLRALGRPAEMRAEQLAPEGPTGDLKGSVDLAVRTRGRVVGLFLVSSASKAAYTGARQFGREWVVAEHVRAGHTVRSYTRRGSPAAFIPKSIEQTGPGIQAAAQALIFATIDRALEGATRLG